MITHIFGESTAVFKSQFLYSPTHTHLLRKQNTSTNMVDPYVIVAAVIYYTTNDDDFGQGLYHNGSTSVKDNETLEIPEGVDYISSRTFYGNINLRKIVFPPGKIIVRESAFEGCINLSELVFPEGSEVIIEEGAFRNCGFVTLDLREKNVTIGDSAFAYCENLKSVTLPALMTYLSELTFANCSSLDTVVFPDSLLEIGPLAFSECGCLQDVDLPSSLGEIWREAFGYCGLTEITLPKSVTSVGSDAFIECTELRTVTILGTPTIGDNAFVDCGEIKIVFTAILQDLGGNTYPVVLNTETPFRELVSEQLPEELAKQDWEVMLPEADEAVRDLDLSDLIANGTLSLAEPWFLHYLEVDPASNEEE